MNFHNLDKIMDNVNVHNKYLLTAIIAQRARQISEVKGVNGILEKHPGEKAISLALCDMEDGGTHHRPADRNDSRRHRERAGIGSGVRRGTEEAGTRRGEKKFRICGQPSEIKAFSGSEHVSTAGSDSRAVVA